jgi:hypothetical protein
MKKRLQIIIIAAFCSITGLAHYSLGDQNTFSSLEHYSHQARHSKTSLDVKYFAHNSPSIKEYVDGKARISAIISNILDKGFISKIKYIEIGIAPRAMGGGNIVLSDDKIYVSITSTDEEIESVLLNYFSIVATARNITYFAHNQPTIAQFLAGKAAVEGVLKRFADSGLGLDLPKGLEIGIAPKTMSGGNIVLSDDKIYVSITSTSEELERYFIRYVRDKAGRR